MNRAKTLAIVLALVIAVLLPQAATAQTSPLFAPPPSNYSIDERGVDLTSGRFVLSLTPVEIGQPGGSGLAYTRTYIVGTEWRDNITGTLSSSGSTYYVSIGAASDVFTLSGSTFTPVHNVGQTLTLSGSTYTYTLADGTVATFSGLYANQLLPPPAPAPQFEANRGRLTELRRPNGETLAYEYEIAQREIITEPNWWAIRLNRVTSNYGYALELTYEFAWYPDYDDVEEWRTLETVTAINLATCTALAVCPSGTVWPSATFSGNNIIDQSGRTTYYGGSGAPSTRAIRLPQNPSVNAATIAYDSSLRVTAYATGGGTWTYSYAEAGGVRTVTITDPASGVTVAKTNMTTGLLTSIKDPLNRTTAYTYDANRRPTKITYPEGNAVNYAYDARGNVATTTVEAPPASTETDIVSSATYAATCTNRVTCNQPATTTDPRGAVTNYEYDATHGGVTKITLPAPTTGAARPETRIAYAARHAWVSNGSGGYMEWAAGVTLPISVSTCASGSAPACLNTANEVRSTITYGATGVANNLQPTVIAQGAGNGSLMATTTLIWTNRGDVASIDGPLTGTADTTTFRYDDNRQQVGIIGPDPDGTDPLPRRAQRNTFNLDGAVTLAEQGTVVGLTDPNWAAFVSLQQQAATYDPYGRPTHQRVQSGATTYALAQVSYDTSGRLECAVTRMNPATFAAPPTSACTAATAGSFGPDRIVKSAWDAAGQLISTISGFGSTNPITESVTYTDNGQLETLTDGEGNVSTLEYDGFGRLVRMHYPNPVTTDDELFEYDAGSNVVEFTNRAGETTTMAWDALDRVTSINASDGTDDVAYTYDNLGRPLTAAIPGGQTLTYAWDALSRPVSETGPLGAMGYEYDSAGRMTRIIWPDAFYAAYDHDVYGEVTAVREKGPTSALFLLATYDYDALGRLTGITRGNGASTAYGYDAVSRLVSMTQNPAGTTSDLTLGFSHNPAGQITGRTVSNQGYVFAPATGVTAYANDSLNRVTEIDTAEVSYDANQNITAVPGAGTYGYDSLNRLTSANPGSGTSIFAYDPADRLYQSGAGGTATRFQYAGDQLATEYNASGAVTRRHVPALGLDDIAASYDGSGTTSRSWPLTDERGSVVALTGASGAVATLNRYDEYGVPASGNAGRFQYTGQAWLAEAGLYHYRARAYLPQIGRFLQTDPIGYAGGANLYAYVGADPVNWVDPFGLQHVRVPCLMPTPDRMACADIWVDGRRVPSAGFYLGDGSLGGRGSFGRRGGGSGFGYRPRFNPVQNDPAFAPYQAERLQAFHDNQWMVWLVLAPEAVVGLAEAGTALTARGIAKICNCFEADTVVATDRGPRSIQEIAVGDLVLARDEQTGETTFKTVVALIDGAERQIWEVIVETVDAEGVARRETIGTTDEHPWRLVGGDWAETAELYPGAELITASGARAVVVSVVRTERVERTYNFEVGGFHTYFVGEAGAWVHNSCRPYDFPRSVKNLIRALTPNCSNCGVRTTWGLRDVRGVTPSPSRSEIHHRVPGVGRGVSDGINLCRACHRLEHP